MPRQKPDNTPADAEERRIGQHDRDREDERHPPLPTAPYRREQHSRIELAQHRAGPRQPGRPARQTPPQPQRQGDEEHDRRIDMAAAAKLPERQGMPGIDQNPRHGPAAPDQDVQHQADRRRLKSEHRRLHDRDGFAEPGRGEKDRLRRRRIYRRRVIAAVDLRKDFRIAQLFEMRVGRDIAVGVDASGQHSPVPDIAVNISRQIRRREQRHQPHRRGDPQDQQKDSAGSAMPPHQRAAHQIRRALDHRDDDEGRNVVLPLRVKSGSGQKQQQQPANEERGNFDAGHL